MRRRRTLVAVDRYTREGEIGMGGKGGERGREEGGKGERERRRGEGERERGGPCWMEILFSPLLK